MIDKFNSRLADENRENIGYNCAIDACKQALLKKEGK